MQQNFSNDLRDRVSIALKTKAFPDGIPLTLFESILESEPWEVYVDPVPPKINELLLWWRDHHVLKSEIYGIPDEG